jgi:LysR family transcriptional regulator, hydrogen peroxide-inducible genes activator
MRYAVLVDETRSFRVAAERAHVTQPGLSMQLMKLEELLGVTLFDRKKKPILVTAEGARALVQMRIVLRETERLAQVAHLDDEPSGTYRLGVIPTLAPTVIPLFLAEFETEFPKVELIIEELQTREIIERLGGDRLEAGLLSTPLGAPGLEETRLGAELLYAYLPPGDPLAGRENIKESDLRDRRLWVMPEGHCFRTQVLSFCDLARAGKKSGKNGRVHFESGSFETLIRLVDAGLGVTVLPELVVQKLSAERRKKQVRAFRGVSPVRELGLVTSRRELHERVTRGLLKVVKTSLGRALLPPLDGKTRVLLPE